MKSNNARRELERLLAGRGTRLATLGVRDGFTAMMTFYRELRASDVVDSDGDMLLFQWGTHDWGKGPRFELDLTRQLIRGDGDDEGIWQLSLTFCYPPRELVAGDRWCNSLGELDDLATFIWSHPAYLAVAGETPLRVELDFECAG